MATDISSLRGKVENEGMNEQGRCSAAEFDTLVTAVMENQGSVKAVKYGSLDPIAPDENGLVTIPMLSDSWTDLLRLQRKVVRDNVEVWENVANEGVYLYRDSDVPVRMRFQEYRQTADPETGEMTYDASNANVTVRLIRPTSIGEEVITEFRTTARGYGSTEWDSTLTNLAAFLSSGENTLILEITGSSKGETTRLQFTVIAANLTLEIAEDNGWHSRTLDLATRDTLTCEYYVGGAVDRTLCVQFASGSSTSTVYRVSVPRSTPATTIIQALFSRAEDTVGFFSEGLKTVEAWAECTVGDETVKTSTVTAHIIAVASGSTGKYVAVQGCIESMLNYEAATVFKYNIQSPDAPEEVTFVLADANKEATYLEVPVQNRANGVLYDFTNVVSIQSSYELIRVYVYAKMGGTYVNGGAALASFLVDNSEDFGAVDGADFYLNPSLRSNTESNPARIVNAADGSEVAGSTFSGISWQQGVDGWVESDNRRFLRLLAGSRVVIPYDIYSMFTDSSNHGLTVEVDFAVRNITNEEDPILTIGNADPANPKGIYMKALTGAFMSRSNSLWESADVAWQEGVRTHLVFNFQHNYTLNSPEPGRGRADRATIALQRIYINGVINREYRVTDTSNANELNAGGDIIIGQTGCDIDIYGIRVYKRNLTPDQVLKNYISTLPTVAEKKKVHDANDILDGGVISFEKARAAGYNCIVWHGTHISRRYSDNPKRYGYAEIYQYADGELDKAHSGTLYGVEGSGQGTTAMTYADWNFSFKEDKKTGAGHDEYKYNDKGTLRAVFVDLDGNVGFGKTKFGYQLDEGDPTAKKLVGKINYASPMQSHKMGACNLYNDLYAQCVSGSITDFSKGQRVTVKEKPFLYFVQETEGGDNALKVFKGLATFGPGKADKPTWGVTDDTLADGDSLVEGALNNNPLTDMRVPFVDTKNATTGRYVNEYQIKDDLGNKTEAFVYAGAKNINWGFGDTVELHPSGDAVWDGVREADKTDADAPTTKQVKMWQPIWNFLYLTNTRIRPWSGTLRELNIAATAVGFDTSVAYWMTAAGDGYAKFDLYRCHYNDMQGDRRYVPAGLRLVQGAKTYANFATLYDLRANPDGVTAYTAEDKWYDVTDATTDTRDVTLNLQAEFTALRAKYPDLPSINYNDDPEIINTTMRQFVVRVFRLYVEQNVYLHKESMLFHHETMVLWAGTDNRSKNTYYRLNPYATQTVNGEQKAWPNMEMNDDDLDTIFKTNNSGIQSKPYYALESDTDENGEHYWEGQDNVLNNTLQDAYGYGYLETAEINMSLANMMGRIFSAMQSLAGGKTMPDGTAVENSPVGCFDYYFFYIQKYFPAVAYNETARIRYEVPAVLYRSVASGDGGEDYPQNPIAQSIGDQYDCEKDYIRRRVTMLAGYAGYRMSQFGFRGYKGEITALLKPHQYVYPMYEVGDQRSSTPTRTMVRLSPAEAYAMQFTNSSATNGMYLFFIGEMREIGNLASWTDGTWTAEAETDAMQPAAARLVKFEMWSATAEGVVFNPRSTTFNLSACQNLEEINVRNAYRLTGLLGLASLVRLRSIDARGTAIKSLTLPSSPNLAEVRLPDGYEEIRVDNCPNLSALTVDGAALLQVLSVTGQTSVDTLALVRSAYNAGATLSELRLTSIDWANVAATLLDYILDIPTLALTGTIHADTLDFATRQRLVQRFGDIDTGERGLTVTVGTTVEVTGIYIMGEGRFDEGLDIPYTRHYPSAGDEITGYRRDVESVVWSDGQSHIVKTYRFEAQSTAANNIVGAVWTLGGDGVNNGYLALVDDELNEVARWEGMYCRVLCKAHAADTTDTAQREATLATLQADVECRRNSTGALYTITGEYTIGAYTRNAADGDMVYHDGWYDDHVIRNKACIGICFWVNPSNPSDRRMVAARAANTSRVWGLARSSSTNSSNTSYYFAHTGDNQLLFDMDGDGVAESSPFDVRNVAEVFSGYGYQYLSSHATKDANGNWHMNNAVGASDNATQRMQLTTNLVTAKNLLDAQAIQPAVLQGLNTAQLQALSVPIGQYDTWMILVHRDRVAKGTQWPLTQQNADADDNAETTLWSEVFGAANPSTQTDLNSMISQIQTQAATALGGTSQSSKYQQFLYPAASHAYLYDPMADTWYAQYADEVRDEYKQTNWYLPSSGELARIFLYLVCSELATGYTENTYTAGRGGRRRITDTINGTEQVIGFRNWLPGEQKGADTPLIEYNDLGHANNYTDSAATTGSMANLAELRVFETALVNRITLGITDLAHVSTHWSSTEYSSVYAAFMYSSSGTLYYYSSKAPSYVARPVSAF